MKRPLERNGTVVYRRFVQRGWGGEHLVHESYLVQLDPCGLLLCLHSGDCRQAAE